MDGHDDPTSVTASGYISDASSYYDGDISALMQLYEGEDETDLVNAGYQRLSDSDESKTSSKRKRESDSPGLHSDAAGPSKRIRPSEDFDEELPAHPDDVHIIAHSPTVASLIERIGLTHGVRYELARLISSRKLRYRDITEESLLQLRGSNQEVIPKISEVFFGKRSPHNTNLNGAFASEIAALSPWAELDKEETALSFGPYEGLGNNPRPNYTDWYGGKVRFSGHLKVEGDEKGKKAGKHTFRIILDDCVLSSSFRHSRRWGSWSFLRVKVPEQVFYNAKHGLDIFFKKAFVIWEYVFRACYAMGNNIFFYWTNELYDIPRTIPGRLSLEDFIQWHNPLAQNSNQLMTKWSERMRLGFSNSIPGPRLDSRDCIIDEPDIVSEKGSDMTDGCGFSSKALHLLLCDRLSLDVMPMAFQFRLAGYKGMSMLLINSGDDKDKRMWVRPSQTKIRYPLDMPLDPAMLTIDILRTSHMSMSMGCTISNDIVINLAENGVPHDIFVQLLKMSIRSHVQKLTTWDGPKAMHDLWKNLEHVGGVIAGRKARQSVGEARVRGFSNRSPEEDEHNEGDEDEEFLGKAGVPRSTAWWDDQISGCPSSLEATSMMLLVAGFTPDKSPILREKLKQTTVKMIDNRMKNLSFHIEQSCSAFAIPDPFGVLGPNEVHIKTSSPFKGEDGMITDIILGDVLVTRNPCKNPCDVRKVKAVEHPALKDYRNIVIFSIQGDRRLIDFLGGGDYDGDTVIVMWPHNIVQAFHNADDALSEEPAGLDLCFNRDAEKVSNFIERTQDFTSTERVLAMQKFLLGALRDASLVGKYSAMHDNAIYQYGYANKRTLKLGAKFCRVLDAPKTGYRIKKETFDADTRMYSNSSGPLWKAQQKEKKKDLTPKLNTSNLPYISRDEGKLGPFIMDVLRIAADKEKGKLLAEMDKQFAPLLNEPDHVLITPWMEAEAWVERGSNAELNKIKQKDLSIIASWVQTVSRQAKEILAVNTKNKSSSGFTNLPIETRQDRLRALSRSFHSGPALSELQFIIDEATLARLRASYAYKYDAEQNTKNGWSRFPWNVAMRDLCLIKASTSPGQYTPMLNAFADLMGLPKRL